MSAATYAGVATARIPADLEAAIDELARRDHAGDRSNVIRQALRRYTDEELHGRPAGGLFDRTAGASRSTDPATSRRAASDVQPRAGSQRHQALRHFAQHPREGLTADDVIRLEQAAGRKVAVNGMARRITDLFQAGAIRERWTDVDEPDHPTAIVTRATRNGSQAQVYVITERGWQWLNAIEAPR